MQSRGTILCFYVSIFFLILFIDKSKIILKSILILTIIISNILFIELYLNKDQSLKEKTNQSRLLKKNTSGRIDIWNYTLKNYNYKNIFGYGSQGDRFFLEKYENNINYGTNSSNAILYAFLSGGYLAVILMIFI